MNTQVKKITTKRNDSIMEETTMNKESGVNYKNQDMEKNNTGKQKICCLCGKPFKGWGNNPDPLAFKEDERCCDFCNDKFVIPARIIQNRENRAFTKEEVKAWRRYARAI